MGLFGWGKIKEKALVEDFGDVDDLVGGVPLTLPAPPAPPDVAAEAPEVSIEGLVEAVVRDPLLDVAPALARLPPVAPRAWMPTRKARGADAGGLAYLELAGIDPLAALELAEQLGEKLKA